MSYKKIAIKRIHWETLKLPSSPNYCLLTPNSNSYDIQNSRVMYSPQLNCSIAKLEQTLIAITQHEPRLKQLKCNAHDSAQQHYIQRSLLFRFPDLITIECHPINASTSTFTLYSRSIYGYSDFGVNKRRVENYLKVLTKELTIIEPTK
ncbi:DUF1499 domain-containing protein [Piscirickettsia litoralis]|uniref:DUF1499 domain-containing protein n=1 Tax=Piscirickettsia litoralis TaxID=1891921 RepID=UPI001F1AC963|nr:DUF1499 domain-containing protein [Piscirickettsia litoralis]